MISQSIHQVLEQYWSYPNFRPLQENIINSVLNGQDTLALLPTGGGKSICFQVPALAQDGVCIVVSPLIALMKDQVQNLKKRGIEAFSAVSGISQKELDIALDNCIYGKTKFLYLSPERLKSELVRTRIGKMNVNLLAVDEAHCISQWGYDFRPPYLDIVEIRDLIPDVPIMALTATATPKVVIDIQEKLKFKQECLIQGGFTRENIAYVVLYEDNELQKLLDILNKVNGTGIVYVRNRKQAKKIAEHLNRFKISADYYHAGLNSDLRQQKQNDWTNNKTRVIVSTNAFGMGIDKPDVRVVVHMDMPESPEAYFQEAGRAGRDQNKAYAALLYNESDRLEFEKRYEMSFPSIEEIKRTYQALANYLQLAIGDDSGRSYDLDLQEMCSTYDLSPVVTYNSIKFLEKQGTLSFSENFYSPSRLMILVDTNKLYKFQVENKHYDDFIKLLLRSYEGLFDDYAKINELDISKRIKKPKNEIASMLFELKKRGLISYFPQKSLPQVMFLKRREDANELEINKAYLKTRKEVYKQKMDAILNYAESIKICRSQQLLSYFGETDSAKCGKCDVCLGRNDKNLDDKDYEVVRKQIKACLNTHTLTLPVLVSQMKGVSEHKTLKAIQWMQDHGILKVKDDDRVELVQS
ncbi:MAG: RecQ family ATP-dependent DNA helicase [Bacteroidia bacterium]|nr:RecQ family ATP-dependent DNA helicase [Bacteroidia bacterium]